MLTLVHAADCHLETTFTEIRGGSRRRAALADAFVRVMDLAISRGADVLTLGGDIYEAQRAGPHTARLIFDQLARFGKPVYVAPGNHDSYNARSIWAREDRPANLHVFAEAAWSAAPLADGITLYGFGHTPAEPGRPFAGARFDAPGIRLALVHGSDEDRCPAGKRATAPFTLREIADAGAHVALTGHYHGGYVTYDASGAAIAYPGSPEPIRFGERGAHGALVITIANAVRIESVELARTRVVDLDVRLDGVAGERAVIAALESSLAGYGADDFVRATLTGVVASGTPIDRDMLAERCGPLVAALEITNRTIAADYEAIAREPNVRGHVVRDLLARAAGGDTEAETALRLVVAAFAGDEIAP